MKFRNSVLMIATSCLFGILACNISGLSAAEEVIGTLPVFPEATLLDQFTTSYPDSIPSAGEIYITEAKTDEIIDFYAKEMPLAGWELVEFLDSDNNNEIDQVIFVKGVWRFRLQVFEEQPNRFIIRVNKL